MQKLETSLGCSYETIQENPVLRKAISKTSTDVCPRPKEKKSFFDALNPFRTYNLLRQSGYS